MPTNNECFCSEGQQMPLHRENIVYLLKPGYATFMDWFVNNEESLNLTPQGPGRRIPKSSKCSSLRDSSQYQKRKKAIKLLTDQWMMQSSGTRQQPLPLPACQSQRLRRQINLMTDWNNWCLNSSGCRGLQLPNTAKLTKPRWEATGFEFKHDYTVIDSSRQLHSETDRGSDDHEVHEIHKLIDGTLATIEEALDYTSQGNPYQQTNPGMNTNLYEERMFTGAKDFMFAIQKRLKDTRIFRELRALSVLTDPEDQAKMEMETPRSSRVNSPPNAYTYCFQVKTS
ncbi:hypothetical protein Tco_0245299 [Tanacetum coccineum]